MCRLFDNGAHTNFTETWRTYSGRAEGRGWSGGNSGLDWHIRGTLSLGTPLRRLALSHRLALWAARHTAGCGESLQKNAIKQFRLRARSWAPCTGLLQGGIEGEDWLGRNTGGAGWSGEPGEVLGCHQFTPKLGDCGF